MMKLKKLIYLTVLLTFSFSIALSEGKKEEIKIGIITPLTGAIANWGKSIRTAIEIANINLEHKAELIFQDEGVCSANMAISAYRYLTSIKKVDVLVTSCLGAAQAIAPKAKSANLPLFISGRSALDFHIKHPNVLSWLSLLDYEGEAIAELIKKERWKTGAVMSWSQYFGVQFVKGIKNALEKEKSNFSYEVIEVSGASTPSASEVQLLIKNQPEVIFLMLSDTSASFVIKQLRALRYNGKIVLQSSLLQNYNPEVRKNFKGALQQKFIVNEEAFKSLQNQVKVQLGEEVADDFIFSYDGFTELLKASQNCRKQKTKDLNKCLTKSLRNEKWREGASGKFRFMKNGSTVRPMVFRVVSESGFE